MAKIYKYPGKTKSDNFLDKVNPNKISDYLANQHPDLPDRIVNAMALAMIYSTYLTMVCEEENYSCHKLFEQEHMDILFSYDKSKLH